MPPQGPPPLNIDPPLLNSANPWATTLEDLTKLFLCKSTGAVTTRTSLPAGFDHQDAQHQYLFFDPARNASPLGANPSDGAALASLNNLGYSPIPLDGYLGFITSIAREFPERIKTKPFLVSVTGTPDEVAACYAAVAAKAKELSAPLAVEINLSCPNIPGKPPPAYDAAALRGYLALLSEEPEIPIGVKTPPYTHAGDFKAFISALAEDAGEAKGGGGRSSKISFVTATNTLGSCLVLAPGSDGGGFAPQLPGSGVGGMAGPPLHPLALGNVATLRRMLDEHEALKHVRVIGVGGVSDVDGYRRMRSVGAYAVGVGTALGKEGLNVFGKIEADVESTW